MDKKAIVGVLKDEGLDVAEDLAMNAARGAIKLLRVLLPKVSTGFGMAFNMFLNVYEPKIYELIDKIDGEKDLA